MSEHPKARILREFYEAFESEDPEAAGSSFSGFERQVARRGQEPTCWDIQRTGRSVERNDALRRATSRGTLRLDTRSIFADDEHAVAIHQATAHVPGFTTTALTKSTCSTSLLAASPRCGRSRRTKRPPIGSGHSLRIWSQSEVETTKSEWPLDCAWPDHRLEAGEDSRWSDVCVQLALYWPSACSDRAPRPGPTTPDRVPWLLTRSSSLPTTRANLWDPATTGHRHDQQPVRADRCLPHRPSSRPLRSPRPGGQGNGHRPGIPC